LEKLYPVLKLNFSSYNRQCRLNTFKIITLFEQPTLKRDENHKTDEQCDIASMAVELEEIETTFKDYREKIKVLQKLNLILSSKRVPDIYSDFIPRIALGVLTINLRPLWEEAKKILVTFSQINSATYWDIIYSELTKYDDEQSLVWDGVSESVIAEMTAPDEPEETNSTKIGKMSFDCPTLTMFTHIENRACIIMNEKKGQSLALLFAKV
jgi:U3 small nucleolar RNA-associated protein 20